MVIFKHRIKLRLRQLRIAKGWSQVELARRAKVTQAFISQLEAGLKKSPGVVDLLRIAKAGRCPEGAGKIIAHRPGCMLAENPVRWHRHS